jgi:serine/threonine-protein kinase
MGAVLYEMLTGAKLFDVEGTFAVMRAHVEAEPPLPSARSPKVPPALDEIVRKSVAKDPAMRFQSADEFRMALQDVASVTPPMVEPPSLPAAPALPLPPQPLHVRQRHPLRFAMMAGLAFGVLATGLYAIRSLPSTARARVAEKKTSAAVPQSPPAPAVAIPAEPQAPAVVPPPPAAPVETAEPTEARRPRQPLPTQAVRRTKKPEKAYAIRVTGADLQPAATTVPRPASPSLAEAPEPSLQSSDRLEEPGTVALPVTSEAIPGLMSTPPETAPPKPPAAGNRFIRALGKVNPFRKTAKPDSSKTPLKKD